MDFVKALTEGSKVLKRKDDDMYDRLSNRYTIAFLVLCSMFLATKSYVGDPIDCWVPKEFHDNWVSYADNYCWIRNTYFIPINEDLPGPTGVSSESSHPSKPELQYYQWVPIIIAFMILVIAIPVGFWQISMSISGYDVEAIVNATKTSESLIPEKRDETNAYIVRQLARHIAYHRQHKKRAIHIGKGYGRQLYFLYIVTKCLYIAAPIFILFALTWMMGDGYGDYGIRALGGIVKDDNTYIKNPMFPTITMCDFTVKRMGQNAHTYTTQCVLTVNLFNERVFLVIWWWLLILAILSVLGLLLFLAKTILPSSKKNFVMKYLKIMRAIDASNYAHQKDVEAFADDFLCLDGVFMLRLISKNVKDVIMGEIVTALFQRWKEDLQKKSDDGNRSLMSDA